jgi:hypothetical protein
MLNPEEYPWFLKQRTQRVRNVGLVRPLVAQGDHSKGWTGIVSKEPDEAFQDGKLQLDCGRKGLKGSPDLAIEILKKIDAATVFVGDVTPVGKGPPRKTDEGGRIRRKASD